MRYFHLFLLLIIQALELFSQDIIVTRDLGLWADIAVSKEFRRNLTLDIHQEIRLYDNITRIDDYITDVSLSYTLSRNFRLGGGIRYTLNSKRDATQESDFRYNLDFIYRAKVLDPLRFQYRLRFQKEYEDVFGKPAVHDYSYVFRNQAKLRLEISRVHDLYVSAELFRTIRLYREPYFSQWRFFIGDDLTTSFGLIDLSLGYERELSSGYPLSFFFTRLAYTLKL